MLAPGHAQTPGASQHLPLSGSALTASLQAETQALLTQLQAYQASNFGAVPGRPFDSVVRDPVSGRHVTDTGCPQHPLHAGFGHGYDGFQMRTAGNPPNSATSVQTSTVFSPASQQQSVSGSPLSHPQTPTHPHMSQEAFDRTPAMVQPSLNDPLASDRLSTQLSAETAFTHLQPQSHSLWGSSSEEDVGHDAQPSGSRVRSSGDAKTSAAEVAKHPS